MSNWETAIEKSYKMKLLINNEFQILFQKFFENLSYEFNKK